MTDSEKSSIFSELAKNLYYTYGLGLSHFLFGVVRAISANYIQKPSKGLSLLPS